MGGSALRLCRRKEGRHNYYVLLYGGSKIDRLGDTVYQRYPGTEEKIDKNQDPHFEHSQYIGYRAFDLIFSQRS